MTAEEAIKYMNNITAETVGEFGNIMAGLAASGATMIRERVVMTGLNAEGNYFPGYSTKPMLANCSSKYMTAAVCKELTGSKEKRAELKWVTVKGKKLFEIDGGYKEFRNLHGRRIDFVDFNWTGEMMGNLQGHGDGMQVISSQDEHRQGHARIGTLSEEQNAKLAGNTERKGEILMLSESEIDILSETLENWLVAKWNE
jgi:hypothetical protein